MVLAEHVVVPYFNVNVEFERQQSVEGNIAWRKSPRNRLVRCRRRQVWHQDKDRAFGSALGPVWTPLSAQVRNARLLAPQQRYPLRNAVYRWRLAAIYQGIGDINGNLVNCRFLLEGEVFYSHPRTLVNSEILVSIAPLEIRNSSISSYGEESHPRNDNYLIVVSFVFVLTGVVLSYQFWWNMYGWRQVLGHASAGICLALQYVRNGIEGPTDLSEQYAPVCCHSVSFGLDFRPAAFGFPARGDSRSCHFRGNGGAFTTLRRSALNFRYSGVALMSASALSVACVTLPPDWSEYSRLSASRRPIREPYGSAPRLSRDAHYIETTARQGI